LRSGKALAVSSELILVSSAAWVTVISKFKDFSFGGPLDQSEQRHEENQGRTAPQ